MLGTPGLRGSKALCFWLVWLSRSWLPLSRWAKKDLERLNRVGAPASRIQLNLFHGQAGLVTIACDDGVLQDLLFLIHHPQRPAFVVHQLHLDLAIRAILLDVRWPIAHHILVPDRLVDLREDIRQSSLEHGEVSLPTRHLGKGLHLVVRLEVVH